MNEKYMKIAIEEAKKAYNIGEIPVGCVIIKNNKILATAHNLKETKQSILYHAELIAIEEASRKIDNWRLLDCDMYVTMEPCPMCASAIKQARIKNLYYGVENKNNVISKEILGTNDINESVNVYTKIVEKECYDLVKKFFEKTRKR